MSKVKKKQPQAPDAPHLDDTITEVTDTVAKTIKRYRIPVLVGVVALVALLGLSSVFSWYSESQALNWNKAIQEAFAGGIPAGGGTPEPAKVRASVDKLLVELSGKSVGPTLATRYAMWLWNSEQDNATQRPLNRAQAVEVLEEALKRHPQHPLLISRAAQYREAHLRDQGFTVPEPPAPPVVNITPVEAPGTVPGTQPGTIQAPTSQPAGAIQAPTSQPAAEIPAGAGGLDGGEEDILDDDGGR